MHKVPDLDVSLDTDEAAAWQLEQDSHASAYLQSLPGYSHFLNSQIDYPPDVAQYAFVPTGDRLFRRVEGTYERPYPRIVTAPADAPAELSVVFDCNEVADTVGAPVGLDSFEPSPDGQLLAVTYSVAGDERSRTLLIDVETRRHHTAQLPWTGRCSISWRHDSKALLATVSRMTTEGVITGDFDVYEVVLSEPLPTEPEETLPVSGMCRAQYSGKGGNAVLNVGWLERAEQVRRPDGRWQRLLPPGERLALGTIIDREFLWLTTEGAPKGRIVRCQIGQIDDPQHWKEVVSEGTDVLISSAIVEDHVIVGATRDMASIIKVFSLDGTPIRELRLPGLGTIGTFPMAGVTPHFPMFHTDDRSITFVYSTPVTSHVQYRYHVTSHTLEALTSPKISLPEIQVSQIRLASPDGTPLLATVVRPNEVTPQPHPTWLTCYGSFGGSLAPGFDMNVVPWIQSGGVYVIAHVRGGGEFGTDWYENGRFDRKQNTYDDLYAIAEHLTSIGVTTTDQLGLEGASAGGLLAGVAMMQRPDLWAAVVLRSPLLDLLGATRDPMTLKIVASEYGDPLDPRQAEWLRSLSPVEIVNGPRPLTAALILAGQNDPRCPAWHARKFVRLAQEANTSPRPILLRVPPNRGHAAVGRDAASAELAEWQAFLAAHTGLERTLSPSTAS